MTSAADRPRPDDDAALVRRARDGDMKAFEELVMRHADGVYVVLRRFGLDDDEARDVAQETFLRAWRGLPRFEARARFFTWLYRIAYNEAQRRLSKRPPAGAGVSPGGSPPADPPAGAPGPREGGERGGVGAA